MSKPSNRCYNSATNITGSGGKMVWLIPVNAPSFFAFCQEILFEIFLIVLLLYSSKPSQAGEFTLAFLISGNSGGNLNFDQIHFYSSYINLTKKGSQNCNRQNLCMTPCWWLHTTTNTGISTGFFLFWNEKSCNCLSVFITKYSAHVVHSYTAGKGWIYYNAKSTEQC